MRLREYACALILTFVSFTVIAANLQPNIVPTYNMEDYNAQINHIYKNVLNNRDTLTQRIIKVSSYFLGKPYLLFATGEGPQGEFDKNPLYRTDAFDCMTYVEMTIALAKSDNLAQFQENIKNIRYKNGIVAFIDRNHFTSVDWNENNTKNGYIKDVTAQLTPDYQTMTAVIDKPNWYKKLPPSRLRLFSALSPQETVDLLDKLHANAEQVSPIRSDLRYVPFSTLYHPNNGGYIANEKIFSQIPNGALIEIVDPTRNNIKLSGTPIEVSHLGFAVRTQQGLMFREASQIKRRVVDVPLVAYLQRYAKLPGGIAVKLVV